MEPPPPPSMFSTSTRKQNVACDACRAKKIRCQRVTTAQRCGQCVAKDLECTSNYIEQLQNKPRRPRRFKANSNGSDKDARRSDDDGRPSPPTATLTINGSTSRRSSAEAAAVSRDAGPSTTAGSTNGSLLHSLPTSGRSEPAPLPQLDDPLAAFAWMQTAPTPFKRDAAALQSDLLRYLFCPVPVLHQEWRYSDVWAMEQARVSACDLWEEATGNLWDEAPSAAHLAFWASADTELESLALELIDTFFTIVEPRLPIFDPNQFLARFQNPLTDLAGPLPHALLATVLAFGARFADHNILRLDREECTARDTDAGGRPRSRIVQLLVVRGREVTEMKKVCRTSTLASVQTQILLEGLLGQSITMKRDYRAYYLSLAARQLENMRDPMMMTLTAERDEKTRTQLGLVILAGVESALYRLPPGTWGGDIDSGGYESVADTLPGLGTEELWLTAARTATGIVKRLCADLWLPRTQASGIPLARLRDFVHDHSSWRDMYLGKLGMPASFPSSDLEFAATMKAATTDILFHGMWLVAERAVRDFGIQESDDAARHMFAFEMQQMKDRLNQEAAHSAMRITMLAALTAEQGLLRLDPLILYRPIYDAGMFLARRGQDECMGCVAGLKQYAMAYPQIWELATEIETALHKVHLASAPVAAFTMATVSGILA